MEIPQVMKAFLPPEKGERVSALLWFLANYTCRAQDPKREECSIIEI